MLTGRVNHNKDIMKKQETLNLDDEIPKGYTRVTEVLAPYKNFDNVLPEVLAHASDRGDKVHDFCDLYALNMLIEKPSEEVKPYFESFKNWFDEYVDEVIYTEKRLSHPDLFLTGQFDLLCRLKGSPALVLVDHKTPKLHEISWRMQMAAYRFLIRELLGLEVDRRISLRLDSEGKEPKIVEYMDHAHDERLYLNQVEIYRCFFPVIK
jgi:hypothetical protein